MHRIVRLILAPALALLASAGGAARPLPLLPTPAQLAMDSGSFSLSGAAVLATDDGATAAASRFQDLLTRSGGPVLPSQGAHAIRFVRDAAVKSDDAYRLVVTPASVTVSASGDAGLFYGAETLWQLATLPGAVGRIPALHIEDRPALAWRGLMLDSTRHFQPVAYVKQTLDRMAAAKLNIFHWHLTDDQAWRIEIDRYPRLTKVGAWRVPAGAEGRDPATGKPLRYGGFYTKAEIRDVVAYAAARHITIVPEIEMPGHATAAIAAYPYLGSAAAPASPSSSWGVFPNLFVPTDQTFTFLENVLDEVMALFPGRYIHIGGDEAPTTQWATNEHARALATSLGYANEAPLHGWFTARIGAYLAAHGRRLIGWDEILQGGVPADATVMSWHGIDGAVTAARAGHDAVLSPAPILYLDNRQSDAPDEPPGRGTIIDWKQLYAFDPSPASLGADERRHILGLQANLWTEHVRTTDYADRMIWPRAAIVAELGWSPPATRDWAGFAPRLVAETARWQRLGWAYDASPLEPQVTRAADDAIALVQPAGIGETRFALDGRAPTMRSPLAAGSIPIGQGLTLAAQSFLDGQPIGALRRWRFDTAARFTRSAPEMTLCSGKIVLRIEDDGPVDGPRAVHWADIMRPCWLWRGARLDGVTGLAAEVGSVPFNFSIGADIDTVTFRKPATPAGELEVREDRCDGPRIATLPLASAAANPGVTRIEGPVAASGTHDLCLTFTQSAPEPMWLLDRLTLIHAPTP